MAAGDVWRLQKEVWNAKDVLQTLTKHNKKFLHLRDKIIPNLEQSLKKKQEKIKANYIHLVFKNTTFPINFVDCFSSLSHKLEDLFYFL